MQVVSPAQNKRSLATNCKETRFIFLHFLLAFGICFPIISNISPSHPEHPCICGCKIKIKKKSLNKTMYKTSAVRNSWRFSSLAPKSTKVKVLQTILTGARPNPYRTWHMVLKKQNHKDCCNPNGGVKDKLSNVPCLAPANTISLPWVFHLLLTQASFPLVTVGASLK